MGEVAGDFDCVEEVHFFFDGVHFVVLGLFYGLEGLGEFSESFSDEFVFEELVAAWTVKGVNL